MITTDALISESAYEARYFEQAAVQATLDGMEIVYGDAHTLLLDLDGEDAKEIFQTYIGLIDSKWGVESVEGSYSKSGLYHAVVKMTAPVEVESHRIALQAALGSDGKREALAILRLQMGFENTSRLFRPQPLQRCTFGVIGEAA